MREHLADRVNEFRISSGPYGSDPSWGLRGAFEIPRKLLGRNRIGSVFIIADPGENTGWEHVSVSIRGMNSLPTWEEMGRVKNLFWREDEAVVQFHPPEEDYVNNAEVLHLWKQREGEFPLPPSQLVGVRGLEVENAQKASK